MLALRGHETPERADSAASALRVALAIALAVGIGLRLRLYLANRSLWLDEAYLALNLIERDLGGLMRPLADNQAAPLGFLFVERLLIVLFGAGELTLRAFPLVAGIVALLVLWRLASALLTPAGATMAVAAFAVSEPLLYYATEAKQYGVDAAVTVLVWMVFVRLDPGLRDNRPGAWAAAAGVGALAIWFSHPAVFVVGGVGLRWLWKTVRVPEWRSLAVRATVGALCAASFALSYVLVIRPVRGGTTLHELWERSAAPVLPLSSADLGWYVGWLWTLATLPLGRSVPAELIAALLLVGVVALWLRRRDQFWWIAGTMALGWVASALGNYPLASRLWLFSAPIMILLLAAAVDEAWRRTRDRLVFVAPVIAAVVLALPIWTSASLAVAPPGKEEIRPLLHHIRQRHRDGDGVYLNYPASIVVRYYAALGLGLPGDVTVAGGTESGGSGYERDVARLRDSGRVWVLFSHERRRPDGTSAETAILEVLNGAGVRVEERHETGAALYVYEF